MTEKHSKIRGIQFDVPSATKGEIKVTGCHGANNLDEKFNE